MRRETAIEIARQCAKAKPQSYYSEPFEPHEWVIDAIVAAARPPTALTDGHTTLDEVRATASEMHELAEMRAEETDDTAATLLSKGAAMMEMMLAAGKGIENIADRRERKQGEADALKYRALHSPEKIDQLALGLAMMGVHVPPRDKAFFQANVQKWLAT